MIDENQDSDQNGKRSKGNGKMVTKVRVEDACSHLFGRLRIAEGTSIRNGGSKHRRQCDYTGAGGSNHFASSRCGQDSVMRHYRSSRGQSINRHKRDDQERYEDD